jgi:hypothetical protein
MHYAFAPKSLMPSKRKVTNLAVAPAINATNKGVGKINKRS